MALAERYRLRSPRSFSQVYRRGRKAHGRYLVVRAVIPLATSKAKLRVKSSASGSNAYASLERVSAQGDFDLSGTRFGISISRKVSKKAVVRNRIKRRIRAVLIALMPRMRSGYWVVITVRSAAISCEYDDFLRELEKVLTALEVLNGD